MIALITGSGGQLAAALEATAPAGAQLRAVAHRELDIADESAVSALLRDSASQVVFNAAAFTRVDDAEREREAAARANALGPAVLARACRGAGAWLVHVSSDYVFDGTHNRPYPVDAAPNPHSVYGRTKLEGEQAVERELPGTSTVVRASWVYSAGHRNFVTTMLARMRQPGELRVVSDQVGAPTAASGLARVLWELGARRAAGRYHWCDSGVASWYDFAVAIAEESVAAGLLPAVPAIVPVGSSEYPRPAPRPRYSVLDKSATEALLGLRAAHWRVALRDTLRTAAAAAAPVEAGGTR